MNLVVNNIPSDFWDTKNETVSVLQKYGFQIYENVGGERIYVIANADGTFKSPTIAGFSPIVSITANNKVFTDTGEKITLPGYGALTFQEIVNHADVGSKIFFRKLSDYEIDRIVVTSVAWTGKCLSKVVKYVEG